jgi:ribose transport system substrate-binding protein
MSKNQANLQANIVYSTVEVPWRAADALARHFTGMSVDEDSDKTLPNWYMTPDSIPAEALKGPIPWVADYQAQYKKLWGKG